jgi:hypothetical protein
MVPRISQFAGALGRAVTLAACYQNRAVRMANDALGDASYEPAPYGAQSSTAHDDQTEPRLLLAELEYLLVRISHPQVRLRDGPPTSSTCFTAFSSVSWALSRISP